MRGSGEYRVTHAGTVIGRVELPEGRTWAGGRLEPAPGLAAVAPILAAAATAGPEAAARVAALPLDAPLDPYDAQGPHAEALSELAAVRFGLEDAAGLPVGAAVRVVDLGDGGAPVVRVDFRAAGASEGAPVRPTPRWDQGAEREF